MFFWCCKNYVVVYALSKKSIFPSHLHKSFSSFIGQPLMDIRETVTDTNNFWAAILPLPSFIPYLYVTLIFIFRNEQRIKLCILLRNYLKSYIRWFKANILNEREKIHTKNYQFMYKKFYKIIFNTFFSLVACHWDTMRFLKLENSCAISSR